MTERWLHLWEGTVAHLDTWTRDGRILYGHEVYQARAIPSRDLPLPLIRQGEHLGAVAHLTLGSSGKSIHAAGVLDLLALPETERQHLLDGGAVEVAVRVDGAEAAPFGPTGAMLLKNWQVLGVDLLIAPNTSAWVVNTSLCLMTGQYADLRAWPGHPQPI